MKARQICYWCIRYSVLLLAQGVIRPCNHWRLILGRGDRIFAIDSVFCQLGNNVQQIFVAIAHAERYSGQISMSREFYRHVSELGIIPEKLPHFIPIEKCSSIAVVYRANFFHYSSYSLFGNHRYSAWKPGFAPPRSSIIGEQQITEAARSIALRSRSAFDRLLQPLQVHSLCPRLSPGSDLLVLHLRAGDVSTLEKSEYATNPLCYYECLSKEFRNLLIVTQPGPNHILLSAIVNIFANVKIVRGDYREDFALIANATLLATSGVSTFPIAAALLSTRLERLYASDAFLREHLNPLFLQNRVDIHLFRMPGFFRLWMASPNREELLHQYRPSTCEFSPL